MMIEEENSCGLMNKFVEEVEQMQFARILSQAEEKYCVR